MAGLALLFIAILVVVLRQSGLWPRRPVAPESVEQPGKKSIADRVAQYGIVATARMKPFFEGAGIDYPPAAVTFLGLKEEKRLEVYARNARGGGWVFIRDYPILAASGGPGPKLREGDRQVPEGIYRIESLNPNSLYHLSLRVNYPNAFDLEKAAAEGRDNPGSDIMIHGSDKSIGCLAMGDPASEDLFILAADVGKENIRFLLAPCDFRNFPPTNPPEASPEWLPGLYQSLADEMNGLRRE